MEGVVSETLFSVYLRRENAGTASPKYNRNFLSFSFNHSVGVYFFFLSFERVSGISQFLYSASVGDKFSRTFIYNLLFIYFFNTGNKNFSFNPVITNGNVPLNISSTKQLEIKKIER